FQCFIDGLRDAVLIIGVQDLAEGDFSSEDLLFSISGYLNYLIIKVYHGVVLVVAAQVDDTGDIFSQEPEPPLGVAQLFMRFALLADVGRNERVTDYRVVVVVQGCYGQHNRKGSSI